MKYWPIILIFFIYFNAIGQSDALNTLNRGYASGGEATGAVGTISYSVGQVFYSYMEAGNSSISAGVQQASDQNSNLSLEDSQVEIIVSVYPNPVTDYAIISISDYQDKELMYHIYNLQGRLILMDVLNSDHTSIYTNDLSASTYFLKISENNQIIKTFKIVKT